MAEKRDEKTAKLNYGALAGVGIPIGTLIAFLVLQSYNPRLLAVTESAQFQRACIKFGAPQIALINEGRRSDRGQRADQVH